MIKPPSGAVVAVGSGIAVTVGPPLEGAELEPRGFGALLQAPSNVIEKKAIAKQTCKELFFMPFLSAFWSPT